MNVRINTPYESYWYIGIVIQYAVHRFGLISLLSSFCWQKCIQMQRGGPIFSKIPHISCETLLRREVTTYCVHTKVFYNHVSFNIYSLRSYVPTLTIKDDHATLRLRVVPRCFLLTTLLWIIWQVDQFYRYGIFLYTLV